jgi:preprotein translocase subunit SecD
MPGDAQGWTVACDAAQTESYLLWPADLGNSDVASASEVPSGKSTGQWYVNVSFTPAGQHRFAALTQRSLGMQVALVVDGVVESAPVIATAIEGDAQITGTMTEPQAQLLATLIGNGALPVALRPQGSPTG